MTNAALIVAIVGIVISGVVGPSAPAWAARKAARNQFVRDQAGKRREELRVLLDETAAVLGLGPTRLRKTREAEAAGEPLSEDLRAWPEQVLTFEQRLRLRLGADHPLVAQYATVRKRLRDAAAVSPDADPQAHEDAVLAFERARDEFLDQAQAELVRPIVDKEGES